MADFKLYGATYSVFVRIVRLVLEETRVPYDLIEVDIYAREKVPPDYADRHPFGRIPAFEHDGFRLFEADAIVAYVVDAAQDRALIPESPKERARMIQIMRIMDNYGYPRLIWGVFIEEIERGRSGHLTDAEVDAARQVLAVLNDLAASRFLVGERLTLADIWAYPMLCYFRMTPTGQRLIAQFPKIVAWIVMMGRRPSVQTTRFPREREV